MYNKNKVINWLMLNKGLSKNEAIEIEVLAILKMLQVNNKFTYYFKGKQNDN